VADPKLLIKRWCPTHLLYEVNPPGRLTCSAAWRDQYALEDEIKAQGVGTANAVLQIVPQLQQLTNAILDIIPGAPVPAAPRPVPPRPTPNPAASGTIDL
jgi:hypothetical protein